MVLRTTEFGDSSTREQDAVQDEPLAQKPLQEKAGPRKEGTNLERARKADLGITNDSFVESGEGRMEAIGEVVETKQRVKSVSEFAEIGRADWPDAPVLAAS